VSIEAGSANALALYEKGPLILQSLTRVSSNFNFRLTVIGRGTRRAGLNRLWDISPVKRSSRQLFLNGQKLGSYGSPSR
jgi:hypothetical protein